MEPAEEAKIFNIANQLAWNFYKTNSIFTFDEIQSTAYMGVVKGINSYKDNQGKKLTSWVYSNVKWEILDMFETEKKFQNVTLYGNDDNYSLEERIGSEEFEEDLLNQVLVKRALTALTAKEIKFIYLKFYVGLSYSEIANITNLATSTIGSKMLKALEKMRNKLEEREINNELKITIKRNKSRKIEAIDTSKEYIAMRVKAEAQYIIDNQSTLRETAKVFGVGKSTIHTDLTQRLPKLDKNLFDRVCTILDYNIEDRVYRGGESTKRKYMKGVDENKKAISNRPVN